MIYKEKFGTPSKGWVILVHGLGEHSHRYSKMISMLTKEGYAVYAFDWPGHGKSDGKRGHSSVNEGMSIIKGLIDEIGEKPFLFGHSLGALTVLRYAEQNPHSIKGVIASSPPLERAENVNSLHILIANIVGTLFPKVTINNRLDPHDFSRDKEAVQRYIEDPLIHDRISGALSKTLFSNMKTVFKEVNSLTMPLLILGGTGDKVTPIQGAKRFIEMVPSADKKLKEFDGPYHEIFEDPEWAESFHTTIVDWTKDH
jgi:lysophospholipase